MNSLDDLKMRIERVISELRDINQFLERDIADPKNAVSFGQVKEIEVSIERFHKQGMPIPTELTELKIKVSAQ